MAVVTLNKAGEDVTVGGSSVEVIGTPSGGEIITVVSGNVTFDPSFNQGGDTIVLPGAASDYTAYRVGAEVVITRDDGAVSIRVPVGTAGIEIQFDGNDSRTLSFDTSTSPPVAYSTTCTPCPGLTTNFSVMFLGPARVTPRFTSVTIPSPSTRTS